VGDERRAAARALGRLPHDDHAEDGQEEVYVVLEGSGTLEADDQTWTLAPGTLARVGPGQKRKIVPGEAG
jgi:quercetin dioxygenase-like cupin family protein